MWLIVSNKQKLIGSCVSNKQLFTVYYVNSKKSCLIFFLIKVLKNNYYKRTQINCKLNYSEKCYRNYCIT